MSEERTGEILLVEDNATDVELTLRALKKDNLHGRVRVVRDGVEALDFLFARGAYADGSVVHRPKVILLDLKLPKVDGLEVLRQIKSDEKIRCIPVVVLTSSNEERDKAESYARGVNSYIVKSVDYDEFARAVREVGLYWLGLNEPPREPAGDKEAA